MEDLGAPFNDDQVSICQIETFPNKIKSSFHVIINNNYIIKDMSSIKNFNNFIRSKISMKICSIESS